MTEESKARALKLLEQIIAKAQLEDEEYRQRMIKEHSASKTVGTSWMVYHLAVLRDLIGGGDH